MFVGYRGWKIKTLNGEPTLVSPSHLDHTNKTIYAWGPGENTAQCPACVLGMDEHCSCGLYALKSPEPDLVGYKPDIVGQVLLWGKVIEGEVGFRAKKAAVSVLLLPSVLPVTEDVLNRLSARYSAPLVIAKGPILQAITRARRKYLIEHGRLKYVAAMEQYRKDWSWMGRARRRSGEEM